MSPGESRVRRSVVPAWRRILFHPLTALGLAGAVVALTLYLYSTGVTPVLGYYLGPLIVGALIYVVLGLRHPRGRREALVGEQALARLRQVERELREESAVAASARRSGASDTSIDEAGARAELAMQRFAWGDYKGAVPLLEQLVSTGDGWDPDSPLGAALAELGACTRELGAACRSVS